MDSSSAIDASTEDAPEYTEKLRACLMCRDDFLSQWAGERICPRCKRSTTWRQGMTWANQTRDGKR